MWTLRRKKTTLSCSILLIACLIDPFSFPLAFHISFFLFLSRARAHTHTQMSKIECIPRPHTHTYKWIKSDVFLVFRDKKNESRLGFSVTAEHIFTSRVSTVQSVSCVSCLAADPFCHDPTSSGSEDEEVACRWGYFMRCCSARSSATGPLWSPPFFGRTWRSVLALVVSLLFNSADDKIGGAVPALSMHAKSSLFY